ncbi:MAG: TetR/AcrR family transcriptional regulator [Polyangiaceae bacterium]|nr:TetR/AcrR family transcriptional regulator [Polyangiaceae bacterium]
MRPRRTYKKSEASRQQVLDAAIRALAENGSAHTSVSDIAETAGMSKGAVHYHFESKDDLIAQVLVRCADVMRERVRAAWDAPGEPQEKVRRALREMRAARSQGSAELRVLADLMAQGIHDPKLRQALSAMFEANRQEVHAHLEQSFRELGITPRVPVHVMPRLVIGILDGLALHDFFDPMSPEDEEFVQSALETIALSLIGG